MKRLSLVALIAAIGAHGAAAKAVPSKLPSAKTLATVPGLVESFGQDGDHLVWARARDASGAARPSPGARSLRPADLGSTA